jgi:SAM-dependent methyltransferase
MSKPINQSSVRRHLVSAMARDWDERARKDAFFYIASWRSDWDEGSFFESGEQDYQRFVEPVLLQAGFEPAGKTMLEIGCGAGRMTRSFARRFETVWAFDLSTEMQRRGQLLLQDFENVRWVLGDGTSLGTIEARSMDFVFSYLVLQHLPTKRLVLNAVREMLRVLKPGSPFLFQFNGAQRPTMNWKGRLIWGTVDLLWALGLKRASQSTATWFHLDPEMAGKSWRGAAVEIQSVLQTLRYAGALHVQVTGEETPMTWCWGTKTGDESR